MSHAPTPQDIPNDRRDCSSRLAHGLTCGTSPAEYESGLDPTDEVWIAPMKNVPRCALSIVLTLAVGPPAAFAESLVCYAIHRGDTATQLAQRITGDARNKYQPWFQIVNAATRFVPKSQYNRLRPGWRACIIKESVESRSEPALIEEVVESRSAHVNQFEAAGSPEPGRLWAFGRSAASISRWCGLEQPWRCRGLDGGSSRTISAAGEQW